jgi:mono/diheme cytochrome c family protein
MTRCALIVALIVAGAAFAHAAPGDDKEKMIALGRAIAEKSCSRCHPIGEAGDNPNPKSPAVWRLVEPLSARRPRRGAR